MRSKAMRPASHRADRMAAPDTLAPGDELRFVDALQIARGCTHYSGGYRGDPALSSAATRGLTDLQVHVLHSIGS